MTERSEVMGPVASRMVFENEDVKIWEMDVAPGEGFPLHHHTYDYVMFITGAATIEHRDHEQRRLIAFPSHSVVFLPAGPIESFDNIGKTRFTNILVEIKRPRRADQHIDFAKSNALADRDPLPGVVHLLENSRVRIVETMLAPGESTGISEQANDAAVFVLSGAKVKVVEEDRKGKRSFEEDRPDKSTRWLVGGVGREIVNLGSAAYRELSVRVK